MLRFVAYVCTSACIQVIAHSLPADFHTKEERSGQTHYANFMAGKRYATFLLIGCWTHIFIIISDWEIKSTNFKTYLFSSVLMFYFQVLRDAYNKPFRGKVADDFVNYLDKTNGAMNHQYIYAKAVAIVQSSGTGKSRMLTEVCILLITPPHLDVINFALVRENNFHTPYMPSQSPQTGLPSVRCSRLRLLCHSAQ